MAVRVAEKSFEGQLGAVYGINALGLDLGQQSGTLPYVNVSRFGQHATPITAGMPESIEAATRAAGMDISLGQPAWRCVIPLIAPRDTQGTRLEVAHVLYEAIGDDLLADSVEITVNGTSLTGELIDVACRPRFSYAT